MIWALITAEGVYGVAMVLGLVTSCGRKPLSHRRAQATMTYGLVAFVVALLMTMIAAARAHGLEAVVWALLIWPAWRVSDRGLQNEINTEVDATRRQQWRERDEKINQGWEEWGP